MSAAAASPLLAWVAENRLEAFHIEIEESARIAGEHFIALCGVRGKVNWVHTTQHGFTKCLTCAELKLSIELAGCARNASNGAGGNPSNLAPLSGSGLREAADDKFAPRLRHGRDYAQGSGIANTARNGLEANEGPIQGQSHGEQKRAAGIRTGGPYLLKSDLERA